MLTPFSEHLSHDPQWSSRDHKFSEVSCYRRELFDQVCHYRKPSFYMGEERRQNLMVVYCQQQMSFSGMNWGSDITPKPCNHSLSLKRMPFYSHSCNCLLVSSSKLDTIQYCLISMAFQPDISYSGDLLCLRKPIVKCAMHFYSTLYGCQHSSALDLHHLYFMIMSYRSIRWDLIHTSTLHLIYFIIIRLSNLFWIQNVIQLSLVRVIAIVIIPLLCLFWTSSPTHISYLLISKL